MADFAIEAAPVDLQHLRGPALVAGTDTKGSCDEGEFGSCQRHNIRLGIQYNIRASRGDFLREIGGGDETALREDMRLLHDVGQFADVAGPVVGLESPGSRLATDA